MMRDYARVSPKFWTGNTGRQIRNLGAECQVVALYLMTSPHSNMIGLYYLPITFIAHETGMSPAKIESVLSKLIGAGFCSYDHGAEVVWVHEMAHYQLGDAKPGDNQRVGAANQYTKAPTCTHLDGFYDRYAESLPLKARREGVGKPLASPSEALTKPLPTPPKQSDGNSDGEQRRATGKSGGEKHLSSSPQGVEVDGSVSQLHSDVLSVFAHYRQHHPTAHRKPVPTSKEWRAIKARLAEGYSVDDLRYAIDGCHVTPWNCGENPGGVKYQKLELIVRDGGQVSRFIENAKQHANGPPQVLSEQTQRNLRAAQAWVSQSRQREAANAGS